MPGKRRIAEAGEPTCPAFGCERPAGFATAHEGSGHCRRHGGEVPGAGPFAAVRSVLDSARAEGVEFDLAWKIALGSLATDDRAKVEPSYDRWREAFQTPLRTPASGSGADSRGS